MKVLLLVFISSFGFSENQEYGIRMSCYCSRYGKIEKSKEVPILTRRVFTNFIDAQKLKSKISSKKLEELKKDSKLYGLGSNMLRRHEIVWESFFTEEAEQCHQITEKDYSSFGCALRFEIQAYKAQ